MLPINIYALTRIEKILMLQKLERHMSKRKHALTIKNWEIQSLKSFSEHLKKEMPESVKMNYFYSFQIPKLGKEFDLLRISEDYVINIELKSNTVADENIKKQLLQNRYYLASLGKTVRSYTYISSTDKLIRLTNSGKLIESEWSKLCEDLGKQKECYEQDIEKLFKEENYLISPFTDPERFLSREYFLTFQQKDIKAHILNTIRSDKSLFQGFTGLPGTGKTLLLYDIALELSERQRVCVLHFGSFPSELEQMNTRLKRVDFYTCSKERSLPDFSDYSAILVDAGHRISMELLEKLKKHAANTGTPVIFTYDLEEAISDNEHPHDIVTSIKKLPDFCEYRLTNRIRMNSELSSFIHCMMNVTKYHRRAEYPSVDLSYANNMEEVHNLCAFYIGRGYTYIADKRVGACELQDEETIEASVGICKEFDKVVMVINSLFEYDAEGYLRSKKKENDENTVVRNLFHGLNRAKNAVAIIVYDNETVFETLLSLVQR